MNQIIKIEIDWLLSDYFVEIENYNCNFILK